MRQVPDSEQSVPDTDASRQSKAMNDQLRSDVTSWRAARSETSTRQAADFIAPAAVAPASKPAARTKQAKPAAVAAPSAAEKKKPFGMSYDGMSQADYITYMISRGAR